MVISTVFELNDFCAHCLLHHVLSPQEIPDSGFFISGAGIPDSNLKWDSEFQIPGSRIPQAKISPNLESEASFGGRKRKDKLPFTAKV